MLKPARRLVRAVSSIFVYLCGGVSSAAVESRNLLVAAGLHDRSLLRTEHLFAYAERAFAAERAWHRQDLT